MPEAKDPSVSHEDSMHLGFTFLREGMQEVGQDIRDVNRRVDEVGQRIDAVGNRIGQLSNRMDQRFNRQTATILAIAGAIIAAIKL